MERDEPPREAIGAGRKGDAEGAPVDRPGRLEGDDLDDREVAISLPLRVPEEPQLDLRGRRAEAPGDGPLHLLARREGRAAVLQVDGERLVGQGVRAIAAA